MFNKRNFIKILAVSALTFSTAVPIVANAAENNISINSSVPDDISKIPDNQKVIYLPEGGVIIKRDGSGDFSESHVEENGGLLMTAKEAREKLADPSTLTGEELLAIERSREADPYSAWRKVLARNERYVSNKFSGKGWRFSGLIFTPQKGTGDYLAWSSIGDTGVVGSYNQAVATYDRALKGVIQQSGQTIGAERTKILTVQGGMMYYTFNPAPNSYYIVDNFD